MDTREIQRLEERTLIDRSLTEERDCHCVSIALFGRKPCPGCWWTSLSDDATTREIHIWVEQMHMSTLSFAETRCSAEYLSGHPFQIDPFRDSDMMRTMWGCYRVV
ncbi:hypothetical protein C472_15132 [Halorubrum tebenquichense DSM 14210]|uniref:Uncharacterized protein n=1 Tax=Halorubrum tebenquichense DSM 14210 TaxID=1227485 RepID=M0DEM0_9EURY|nr:hypothetical protein C472_15132 [Halorubrum tebenquichense DSM 14210]